MHGISRSRWIGAKGLKLEDGIYINDIVAWNTRLIQFALFSLFICSGVRLCVTWIYQNWLISAWANRERVIKPGRTDKPFIVRANPQIGRDTPDAREWFCPDASEHHCAVPCGRVGPGPSLTTTRPGPFTKSLATQSLTRKLFSLLCSLAALTAILNRAYLYW